MVQITGFSLWFTTLTSVLTTIKNAKSKKSSLLFLSQLVNVSEVLEVLKKPTETCEILGRVDNKENGLIQENNPSYGHYVLYGGGDTCTNGDNPALNGKPRKSKFKFVCSNTQDENVLY